MDKPSPETCLHILSHAPIGIVITDDAGLILWCNDTVADWVGLESGNVVGRSESGLLNTGNASHTPVINGPHQLGAASGGKQRTIMRYPLPPENEQHTICYMDITEEEDLRKERTRLASQLEQHNTIEPISGLLNQQAAIIGLEPLVSRSRRYQNPLSVVTMTVKNLKDIQGSSGQVAADKMILAISQLLRDQLRWADILGRLDSGDFIFVLPETDINAAIALANKISTQLEDLQISIDDQHIAKAEACFGVAAWTKGDDSNQLLTRSATAASSASQLGPFTVEAA